MITQLQLNHLPERQTKFSQRAEKRKQSMLRSSLQESDGFQVSGLSGRQFTNREVWALLKLDTTQAVAQPLEGNLRSSIQRVSPALAGLGYIYMAAES